VVDPELRQTETDLLFTARLRTGHPVLLYVLLEHQSTVDRWMALRMLRYVVRLVEHWRQEHPESEQLPVILPLVMYHGEDGAWTAVRRVENLFALPGEAQEERERWRALVPGFEYLLEVLAEQEGNEHLKTVLHYLLWIGDEAVHEATGRVLDSVVDAQHTEELMRSYGEELMERGRQQGFARGRETGREEGRQEGRLQERAEAVLRLLTGRGLHVDETSRQLILSCTDVATLDLWFDRAIHATSLSEVLAPPSQ
jgi:predicted transposase/invertase (TIGR01784 family)